MRLPSGSVIQVVRTLPANNLDGAEIDSGCGGRGEPFVEVVHEERRHRPAGPVGVAQHVQRAAVRELPSGLVVIGKHRRRSAEQALVELERGVAIPNGDCGEDLVTGMEPPRPDSPTRDAPRDRQRQWRGH